MANSQGLTRNTILLSLSGGIEFGMQMAIPMIFVRYLEPATFGQYRLLWLIAGTSLAIAPCFMPQSLFYFLPRASQINKGIFIGNVLAYLTVAGTIVAFAASKWNPILPISVKSLFIQTNGVSSAFLGIWIIVSIMNVLPTAEGRIAWQYRSDPALAIFRTCLLGVAAILTKNIQWVVLALLIDALARVAMLLAYLSTRDGDQRISCQLPVLEQQLYYSLPFAFGNGLFLLRVQSDQWIVASMMPSSMFAIFSIGAVLLPISSLIKQPLNNAMLPRLNMAASNGNLIEIRRLISKGSHLTVIALIPIAGGLFSIASELVHIVYTEKYIDAVPVMRVYLVGIMISSFAIGHVLPVVNKGRFAVTNNLVCLAFSVLCSIIAAHHYGLVGAAMGSVLALGISEIWTMRVVAASLNVEFAKLFPWRAIGPSVLATGIGIVGSNTIDFFNGHSVHIVLALKSLTYVILVVIVFFAAGGENPLRLIRTAGFRAL